MIAADRVSSLAGMAVCTFVSLLILSLSTYSESSHLRLSAFTLMAQISCVVGCNRTFTESKNLSLHKKTCLHVQRLRQTSREARKASGHMHNLLNHLPKPLDRKHRLQVLSPYCLFNLYRAKLYSGGLCVLQQCPRKPHTRTAFTKGSKPDG